MTAACNVAKHSFVKSGRREIWHSSLPHSGPPAVCDDHKMPQRLAHTCTTISLVGVSLLPSRWNLQSHRMSVHVGPQYFCTKISAGVMMKVISLLSSTPCVAQEISIIILRVASQTESYLRCSGSDRSLHLSIVRCTGLSFEGNSVSVLVLQIPAK